MHTTNVSIVDLHCLPVYCASKFNMNIVHEKWTLARLQFYLWGIFSEFLLAFVIDNFREHSVVLLINLHPNYLRRAMATNARVFFAHRAKRARSESINQLCYLCCTRILCADSVAVCDADDTWRCADKKIRVDVCGATRNTWIHSGSDAGQRQANPQQQWIFK